jgi:hypothetical protein
MKKIAFFILLALFAQALIAVEPAEEDFYGQFLLQASSLPEMKLGFTKYFNFPFLQGKSPLTQDNNIGIALTAEISPISFNGIASDWENVYYRNLNIDSSNPLRLEFYRVAAALTYKL